MSLAGPADGDVRMVTSTIEIQMLEAREASVTEDTLQVELSAGRTLCVPSAWYPRLVHATPEERNNWELIGRGQGFRWPDLDEDLSVEGLIAGRPSGESQHSFKRWLYTKRAGRSVVLSDLTAAEREGDAWGNDWPPPTTYS